MSLVVDDVRPVEIQLPLDEKLFPIQPLKVLAREGAITLTGLDLSKGQELSVAAASKLLNYLGMMNRATTWWIGDALIYVKATHPEEFSQIIEALGFSEQAALNRMFTCENVPASRRKVGLGFSIHYRVSRLDSKEQAYWLDRADAGNWTLKTLIAEMKASRKDEKPTIPGTDADPVLLAEAAQRVFDSKQDYGADWLVPREPMAILGAALGEEDD